MGRYQILALAALFVAASAISATAHRGYNKRSTLDQLGLSDVQQEQIDALKATYSEARSALHQDKKEGFEAVLNEDQLATLADARASSRRHRHHIDLNLSEDQIAELEVLHAAYSEQKQAIRDEYKAGLLEVLDDDQEALLEELQAARMDRWGKRHGGDEPSADDSSDNSVTTEAALQLPSAAAATAVEETSWGRIKNTLSR